MKFTHEARKADLKLSAQRLSMCDALRDFVPYVQFKKREKYLWRSATFSKAAGFSFSRFKNRINGIK